ncbi:MAG TPA: hypothetical protein VGO93_31240 [Candidatus Xenobia bacterium]
MGRHGAYAEPPSPKWLVVLGRARHFAWCDLRTDCDPTSIRYTVAFVDRYIKGKAADPVLAERLPGVARVTLAP